MDDRPLESTAWPLGGAELGALIDGELVAAFFVAEHVGGDRRAMDPVEVPRAFVAAA